MCLCAHMHAKGRLPESSFISLLFFVSFCSSQILKRYTCESMSVCGCVHMSASACPDQKQGSPGSGVTGGCEGCTAGDFGHCISLAHYLCYSKAKPVVVFTLLSFTLNGDGTVGTN